MTEHSITPGKPTPKRISELADFLELKRAKVAKWFWDRCDERAKKAAKLQEDNLKTD